MEIAIEPLCCFCAASVLLLLGCAASFLAVLVLFWLCAGSWARAGLVLRWTAAGDRSGPGQGLQAAVLLYANTVFLYGK